MLEAIVGHALSILCCALGWFTVILAASMSASQRRDARVWPWQFMAERPLRVMLTGISAGVGLLALAELEPFVRTLHPALADVVLPSPLSAYIAGAASEGTGEIVRWVMRGGLLRQLLEKRLGVEIPVPPAGEGRSLSDPTLLRHERDGEPTKRRS